MSKLKRNLMITFAILFSLIILALVVVINYVDSMSDPYLNEQGFDETTFAGQWPFAVESIIIRCDEVKEHSVLTMTLPDGVSYTINSNKVNANALSAPKLTPQDAIWLNAAVANQETDDLLTYQKVPLDDIIDAGLALCPVN